MQLLIGGSVVVYAVGDARGEVYKHENLDKRLYNWSTTEPLGSIPEVPQTYGYIDGVYGIINEHQLAFGESTCGARFYSKPVKHGGEALFDIAALSRVAMQRTKTARAAIQLMGDLAVKYGYYGAAWEGEGVLSEAGEALTIADPKEAWMFHILPDDTGKSAIWAAQRVPDDHVTVVANAFVIHDVDTADTEHFMASENLLEVAIRHDLWHPDSGKPFDFAAIYSEPSGPHAYSNRRVWRVLSLVNPEEKLSPDAANYPFSVQASRVLSPHDIMRFHRDHYEGTPYDMTKGPAGGPYGDPDRYDGGANGDLTPEDLAKGHFERAISIFRASYSFISILDAENADNAYLWFGQYAPHATIYAPVYAQIDEVPTQYWNSSLFVFDKDSSFWANALVGNWAARFYKYAHPEVEKVQLQLENAADKLQASIAQEAAQLKQTKGEAAMRKYLTDRTREFAFESVQAARGLFESLVTIFHDGYEMSNLTGPSLRAQRLFYPKWWLQQVGFFSDELQPASQGQDKSGKVSNTWGVVWIVAASFAGVALGRSTATWGARRGAYKPIHGASAIRSPRKLLASAFNWAIWGLSFTVVGSQFLGIVWDSAEFSMSTTTGRSPLEPMIPMVGYNDEAYADRAFVCIQEANMYVVKQLSTVLKDPMLSLSISSDPSGVNGFRVVKRETMTLSPQIYDTYARVCDRVAFTLTAIQDSCAALGYNLTRDGLRIVDSIEANATTRDIPRALPVLVVPFWDNAVHSYYVIPSWDGAACVFRLNGMYQSPTLTFGVFRGVPRSIRTTKTETWLQKPGGQWRHGWYEDPQGQPWISNMMTSKNGGPLGIEVRQFDTLTNKEHDCNAVGVANRCKPALIIEKWGAQFTTTTEILQQDQVFISNGKRFGFFLFQAWSKRTTTNTYSLETFISNVSIFALLFRWFVSMAAMHNSYRKGVAEWQTTGIGCLSSSRAFNILPIVLLPRLKMTLTVLSSVGCNFQGQQSALTDAWYVMYPGIVEVLFYYYSLLNIVGKITNRRISDALFGPTLLFLSTMHLFRLQIAEIDWLRLDGRIPTVLLSDQVDAVKLVDFFSSDVALRLNGNVVALFAIKMAVLGLSLLPVLAGEKMTVNGKKSKAIEPCEIEIALASRASNVGGLGRSPVYALTNSFRKPLPSANDSTDKTEVTTMVRAPSVGPIFLSRSTVEPVKGASKQDQVQPMNSTNTHHVLVSYELNRLGYLVYGGKFLITYDDWYVLMSTAPLRVVERLWNYLITVFDVVKSNDGKYLTISARPRICRVDDPQLRAVSFYDVAVWAFH